MASKKLLTVDTISASVVKTEYAVRGELVIRAEEHAKTLQQKGHKLPFNEIVYCNIGNPQSLGQKPLTFFRQLLSLVEYPDLANHELAKKIFPKDVLERAKYIINNSHGTGAYTHSKGFPFVRKSVADFLKKRDGYSADPEDIFLFNGASPAVQNSLRMCVAKPGDGIMIPIPQYPLYSATISSIGGNQVGYYLNEKNNWSLEVNELERSYKEAVANGVNPRALVVINPGNPTGQVLPEANMIDVVKFCAKNKLVLMADEVYQENVYIKKTPFVSFRKVVKDLGKDFDNFELFSFHSVSKGFVGECGHRGGYLDAVGIDSEVKAQLYKMSSVSLCPNTSGQLLVDCMVNPPKPGDESFDLYEKEKNGIYDSLKRRAEKLTKFLDSLEGVSCNPAQGAMYAFPQVKLPPKAVEAAKKAGKEPDVFYCIEMLDNTGVCVVPGSGFGQQDGTWHFRTTFLPPEDQIDGVMNKVAKFNAEFMKKYA